MCHLTKHGIAIIIFLFLMGGCKKNKQTLFEKISASYSDLHFNNKLTPNEQVNAFTFTNFYNGGGVGIGDFNKDGLQDIFFSGNQESSRLYINKGDFKFEDITQSAGTSTDRWCTGVSVVDINQDGWDDIYICVAKHPSFKNTHNILFINQKTANPTFKEEAQLYGLDYDGFSTQTAFFDYDHDGDLDAYLLNTAPDIQNPNVLRPSINNGTYPSTDKLYRNEGLKDGRYTYKDVSMEAGIVYEGLGLGLVVSDINNDGWLDVYGSNDFLSSDVFYLNQGDGTFKNVIKSSMPHTSLFGMGVDAADINNDAEIDLFQLDMMPEDNERQKQMLGKQDYDKKETSLTPQYGYQLQYMRNMLQLNRGNLSNIPQFSDVGLLAGVAKTDWSWSTLMADLDNDNQKDIFITTGYRKNITDLDFISFNQSNNFFGSDANKNETREKLLEQVPEIKLRNYAYRNQSNLQFQNVSESWGLDELSYANGAAYADLDNDGDLDLIVNNIDEEASIFKNKTRETTQPNYLKLNFIGDKNNITGIGAKVTLWAKDTIQVFENQPIRGYLSSMPQGVFVGLGSQAKVDSLSVEWSKELKQTLYNVSANQNLVIDIKNAKTVTATKDTIKTLFKTLPDLIPYVHQESDFNDFKQITSLHKMFSRYGAAATGDINGDNLKDVVLGGAYRGSPSMIYVQQKNGSFLPQKAFETPEQEIGGITIFDADNDSDNDILIVGGSNERPLSISAAYQPTLYINSGKGQFSASSNMPNIAVSSQTVRTFDFDKDGDLDVFIGGFQMPNQYPLPANSYILKNEKGHFTDVTAQIAPFLNNLGMVCDALPTDFDNDNDIDIILTGMWMPLTILENKNAQFELKTMPNTEGWWACVNAGDFDKDGDMDLLLGNEGLNTFYHASLNEPVSLYAKDFNADGQIDPIMGYFIKGKNAPALPRESLNQQIVQFRKKYTRYDAYAKVGFEALFSESDKTNVQKLKAVEMHSCYAENKGNGRFELKKLPIMSQISPIFNFLIADFDKDGNLDAVASGNFFPNEAHMGREDASRGLFLKGKGNGEFDAIPNNKSGLNIVGDARQSYFLDSPQRFFTFINSGKIIVHEWKTKQN